MPDGDVADEPGRTRGAGRTRSTRRSCRARWAAKAPRTARKLSGNEVAFQERAISNLLARHGVIGDPWQVLGVWGGNAPGEGTRVHGNIDSVFRGRILTFMAGWAAEIEILGSCRGLVEHHVGLPYVDHVSLP